MSADDLPLLWRRFKRRGCPEARAALIDAHRGLVEQTLRRQIGALPSQIDPDDLRGAGLVGLVRAVDQFDPEREIQFTTYAITLIRGRMLEYLRDTSWMPRLLHDQQKALRLAKEALCQQLQRKPTDAEIGAELGWREDEVRRIWRLLRHAVTVSLDAPLAEDAEGALETILPSGEASALEQICAEEAGEDLVRAIGRLPERWAFVVRGYYWQRLTFAQIAERLNCSESRVYQMHQTALGRLRRMLERSAVR